MTRTATPPGVRVPIADTLDAQLEALEEELGHTPPTTSAGWHELSIQAGELATAYRTLARRYRERGWDGPARWAYDRAARCSLIAEQALGRAGAVAMAAGVA